MTYLKIQTLTPLHIGSGKMLQGNFEYLYFAEEGKISVIDHKKILNIIGSENIDRWVTIINSEEDLLDYLKQRNPDIKAEQTHSRLMSVEGKRPTKSKTFEGKDKFPEIREFLFSGNQKPMLPGSSLKGSIRTAFLTSKIYEEKEQANKLNQKAYANSKNNIAQEKFDKIKYSDKSLNSKFIGKDPNHDIFRFLQIGDIYFDETTCILSETLNETGKGLEIKDSIKQFIEAVPVGNLTVGEVKVNEVLKSEIIKRNLNGFDKKALSTFDLKNLFYLINAHTKNLIQKEIALYEDKILPNKAIEWVDKFKEIEQEITEIEKKQENACILRVGFGSGFKSMTGDWQKDLLSEIDLQELADRVRSPKYHGLAFPKSRKLILGNTPMGFLKLTLISKEQSENIEVEKQELKIRREQIIEEQAQAKILAQKEAEEQKRLEEEEEKRILIENWKNEPQPFQGELKNGVEIEAKIYQAQSGYAMAEYSEGFGKLAPQCVLEIGKEGKKDEKYTEGSLIKAIYQVNKKGKVILTFKEYIER
jgi:CRISPR type III-A-associated RAMP protein Csm5